MWQALVLFCLFVFVLLRIFSQLACPQRQNTFGCRRVECDYTGFDKARRDFGKMNELEAVVQCLCVTPCKLSTLRCARCFDSWSRSCVLLQLSRVLWSTASSKKGCKCTSTEVVRPRSRLSSSLLHVLLAPYSCWRCRSWNNGEQGHTISNDVCCTCTVAAGTGTVSAHCHSSSGTPRHRIETRGIHLPRPASGMLLASSRLKQATFSGHPSNSFGCTHGAPEIGCDSETLSVLVV